MEIKVMHQVMEWNEDVSDAVKAELSCHQVCLINVLGSPGAGKTSTIISLIDRLRSKYRIGVIEGDITGQIDADRIHALGLPVVQLDTDGACHIEAMSIQHILPHFDLDSLDVLFVENIGNLVCPAEFNIGENFRLAILSVPEGDDKVEKYPLMFSTSQALAINKYDLRDYFGFDDERVEHSARGINPEIVLFRTSSRDGLGLDELADWIDHRIEATLSPEDKEG
ncbi:MAG: hydrogenase nickel incorporation protein HypB [Clostridiales bacterium]|nr:hydrogenase nickel incorporation protein HypB [Clostridiales bacterium]